MGRACRGLVKETRQRNFDDITGELAGCYIFGSFANSDPRERKFIDRTLETYGSHPGLYFEFKERIRKQTSTACPDCGTRIERVSELGVDVLLSVEMIKHSLMTDYDFLVLVSGDRDYIPLLMYLRDQGKRVLHAATDHPHQDMRSITWKQVKLRDSFDYLTQIVHDAYLIFTAPPYSDKTEESKQIISSNGGAFHVIDITQVDEISDKDFDYLLKSKGISFRKVSKDGRETVYVYEALRRLEDLREQIAKGLLVGSLPIAMRDGEIEATADKRWGWLREASSGSVDIWKP